MEFQTMHPLAAPRSPAAKRIRPRVFLPPAALLRGVLACASLNPAPPSPSVFDSGRPARDCHPRCIGPASDINTCADAFPDDFPNFLSLYRGTHKNIKQESPETQMSVTFQ
jgi:hypothetical protein